MSICDQDRYHIRFKGRRTTITVDRIISQLLAVKLGLTPQTPTAHKLIREWLENTLHDKLGENVPSGNRVSQYARAFAIEELAQKRLRDGVIDWRLEQDNIG